MSADASAWAPEGAARWLAEAMESGSPLRDLPADLAPRSVGEGEEIAAATLEALGLEACGVRLLWRADGTVLAGPMIEGRLVAAAVPVARAALRHPQVSAAVVGVLAEALEPDATAAPRFAALHPALDVSDSRFTDLPQDAALLAADCAALGMVVVGRRRMAAPGPARVLIGAAGTRRVAHPVDLAARFAEAAAAARRFGGLPAGAVLVVAGLGPSLAAEGRIAADLGPAGQVEAGFA
jgi:hypothetical protein